MKRKGSPPGHLPGGAMAVGYDPAATIHFQRDHTGHVLRCIGCAGLNPGMDVHLTESRLCAAPGHDHGRDR